MSSCAPWGGHLQPIIWVEEHQIGIVQPGRTAFEECLTPPGIVGQDVIKIGSPGNCPAVFDGLQPAAVRFCRGVGQNIE